MDLQATDLDLAIAELNTAESFLEFLCFTFTKMDGTQLGYFYWMDFRYSVVCQHVTIRLYLRKRHS